MGTVLEAFDLNTFYDRSHILFDVSLNIASGETVCLMGRNGVGKTTLLKSIMGLVPTPPGRIAGGAAYLVAKAIRSSRVVAFAELGMEAVYEFEVRDMPVTVAVDSQGDSVHESAPLEWRRRIGKIEVPFT